MLKNRRTELLSGTTSLGESWHQPDGTEIRKRLLTAMVAPNSRKSMRKAMAELAAEGVSEAELHCRLTEIQGGLDELDAIRRYNQHLAGAGDGEAQD